MTLYNVDEITWQRFRLSLLQRSERVHEVVNKMIADWVQQNPPRDLTP